MNTTSSKATLTVATDAVVGRPVVVERLRAALGDEVRVTSQEHRSQWRNRQQCLERVAAQLDQAARPPEPPRRPTKPQRGAIERRLETKRRDSEKKQGRRGSAW